MCLHMHYANVIYASHVFSNYQYFMCILEREPFTQLKKYVSKHLYHKCLHQFFYAALKMCKNNFKS